MNGTVVVVPGRRLLSAVAVVAVVLGTGMGEPGAARAQSSPAVPGDIYAIDGLATGSGLGGPAARAAIDDPDGVLVRGGNVYIADGAGNRVLEVAGTDHRQWGITMTRGDVYVIAGSPAGVPGASANGTKRAASRLTDPAGLAMDGSGDLFIADSGNDRVVELTASARPWGDFAHPVADALYRVAGETGSRGRGGDGKPATSSRLDSPAGVFIGGSAGGSLYIADSGNNRIQIVPRTAGTRWGQRMRAYDVYTVAGSRRGAGGSSGDGRAATSARLRQPQDVTVDSSGDLLIADTGNCRVQEVARTSGRQWGSISMTAGHVYTVAGRNRASCRNDGNGRRATASDLNDPDGIADSAGNLYIADTGSNVVKEVAGRSGRQYGQPMTRGHIYAIAGTGRTGSAGNGGPAASAELDSPAAVSVNGSGDVYISDTGNRQVREARSAAPYDIKAAAGSGFTLADLGDGGPALAAALRNPDGVADDAEGDLFIADAANNRVQEIAASSHTQFGTAMVAGHTYTIAGSPLGTEGDSGNGVHATAELLSIPTSVAVDAAGDVYICDADDSRVVEIAATTHSQYGIAMTAGDAYTVAGSVAGNSGDSGDGGPATSALLSLPASIAVDSAGDLFIADTVNSRIQEVPVASGTQYGIAMTAGDMYTIAGSATGAYGTSGDGGPGFASLLSDPFGVAVDNAGNVYIADSGNNRIQELAATTSTQYGQPMTAGDIYTIAGSASGTYGGYGDGGPATSAALYGPADVAVDNAGNVYIADTFNNQIREVAAATGSQRGKSMTAGDIYTVAGRTNGIAGPTTLGRPATSTELDQPIDVGLDQVSDIVIPDQDNDTLLAVAATASSPFPVYPPDGTAEAQLDAVRATSRRPQSHDRCMHGRDLNGDQPLLRTDAAAGHHLTAATSALYAMLGVLTRCA